MYLFDRERTGRMKFALGNLRVPELVWETKLRQYPVKGPESSAVIDEYGNIYFGCHDSSIYCLDKEGKIRWQLTTEDKVYASPVLLNDRLFFCCNKADVLCLNLNGEIQWVFNGFKELARIPKANRILFNIYSYLRYDYEFKKYMKINAWGSPNLLGTHTLIVNLYGTGIVALDQASGKVKWKYNLGLPYYHLSGVAITSLHGKEHIAAVSQSGNIFWLDENGKLLWKRPLRKGYNSWSNPSIDTEAKAIYCSTSDKNKLAVVYKLDFSGTLLWSRVISGGIRGGITIALEDYIIVPTLKGELIFLKKKDGQLIMSKSIATKERGLWTTASIDKNGDILINTKLNQEKGSLIRMSSKGEVKWEINYGKALAVPIIDRDGNIYTATWEGKYLKYKS